MSADTEAPRGLKTPEATILDARGLQPIAVQVEVPAHHLERRASGLPGAAIPELDGDIEEWEVRRSVQDPNCKSAAGPDNVPSKALRNLNDTAITALTPYYNDCWGSVLEHVLNNRWQSYLEERIYPATILGFRAKLSTQDAMLLLQHDLLESPSRTDCRAVLDLDLRSAFDKVLHSAILAQVNRLGLGERTYNYIRAFLSHRMACIHVGHLQLDERELGSVVAERLAHLPHVHHTIYADDITLLVSRGTNGHIEESQQKAICEIEACLKNRGLRCSPQKSELLILPPPGNRRKEAEREAGNITLSTENGTTIPHVRSLRMLGLHIDSGNTNHTALDKLLTMMGIGTRLIRRISTRRDGMREPNLLRLLQSFVISPVSYVGAFHRWLQYERDKINAAIRKSHKTAVGFLHSTSNRALASLGVHNTLEEVCEAQRSAQLARLGTTKTGRLILQPTHRQHERKQAQ
ncbi:uncharacterized protein LOC144140028 [Haemaphysalis longicornis]